MEAVLQEINAAVGVTGSFVVNGSGGLEARALPEQYSTQALESLGRTVVQTLAGIELARRRKPGDLEMGFAGGRLLVKSLAPGCLCILTARRVNVSLVNLTANVAVKKLREQRKEAATSATGSAPSVPAPAPPAATTPVALTATPASGTVDGRVFSVIERELARAIGSQAQLVLYYEVAAMGLSKTAFPRAYLGDLVDRVSGEIDDPARKARFMQVTNEAIREL